MPEGRGSGTAPENPGCEATEAGALWCEALMCEEGALRLEMGPLLCWALCSLVADWCPRGYSE